MTWTVSAVCEWHQEIVFLLPVSIQCRSRVLLSIGQHILPGPVTAQTLHLRDGSPGRLDQRLQLVRQAALPPPAGDAAALARLASR